MRGDPLQGLTSAMTEDLFTEDFQARPYWSSADESPTVAPDALPHAADVVVIGAGYTGLHAALVTARGGRATVVLDAGTPGSGCSTRNGGQIGRGVKVAYATLARRHGEARARGLIGEDRRAREWLGTFIADEGIDCDYRICGRFHAAHSRRAFRRLVDAARSQPAGLEVETEIVERAEQQRELGSDAYHGGVVHVPFGALDPARYHAGLLARTRAADVQVFGHCPALSIAGEPGALRVDTPQGTVRARNVIVATNGYSGALRPWLQRRVIPIGSYIIATEPLERGLMERLLPTDRMITDTRRVVYYYRSSPDRSRILFGGRVSLSETDPRRTAPRLHRELSAIFPELARVRVSHSWAGLVAYTFDTLAHTGARDGVDYALGYCGSGVALSGYLGMRCGQRVLGLAESRTAFDGLPFPTRPLYTGKPWFLAPALGLYRWLDRLG